MTVLIFRLLSVTAPELLLTDLLIPPLSIPFNSPPVESVFVVSADGDSLASEILTPGILFSFSTIQLHDFRKLPLTDCQILSNMDIWEDHDENLPRPFGNREVWAGYDPARSGDTSTFVIIAPPIVAGEKFRVLRVFHWQGMNWKWQAAQIKKLFGQYNMTYIGIDITGLGSGVFEDVQHFAMRQAVAIRYGVETKNRLVMKMIDVIEDNRVEWDKEKTEIAASFMTIRRTSTASGNAMTFVADRTAETGHADSFWAIAHAIDNEPLNFENQRKSRWGNLGKAA